MRRLREGVFGAVVKVTVLEASVGKSGRAFYGGAQQHQVGFCKQSYPFLVSHHTFLRLNTARFLSLYASHIPLSQQRVRLSLPMHVRTTVTVTRFVTLSLLSSLDELTR